MKKGKIVEIKDSLGFIWVWDGKRVRIPEVDEIFVLEGTDPMENGYLASSLQEAITVLIDGGYIEKEG